jgi:hypothetical protein
MTRWFCAALVALLGAGLLPAQAQVPDRSALLPAADDTVETMSFAPGQPVLMPRYREVAPEIARESEIVLEPVGVTRREILNRLFADRNVQIEWRNKAFADERVQDRRLTGPPVELARRLLARASYVMVYQTSGDESHLTRILILGSDPPSITQSADAAPSRRSAEAPASVRRESRTSEAERRRSAIEQTRRAITAAQRR